MVVNDLNGSAADAYRLYQAAFKRVPDSAGLSVNVRVLDHGASLHDLASAFVGSAEFTERYGPTLSDTDFVTRLYSNILHRSPDTIGLTDWVTKLQTDQIDRAGALIGFSESPENHQAVDPTLASGIALNDSILASGAVTVGIGSPTLTVPGTHGDTILFGLNIGDIVQDNTGWVTPGSGYWGNRVSVSPATLTSTSESMVSIENFKVDGPDHDAIQFQASSWNDYTFFHGNNDRTMLINGDGQPNGAQPEPLESSIASTPFTVTQPGTALPSSATNPTLVTLDAIRTFNGASDLASSLKSASGAISFAAPFSYTDHHLLFAYVASDNDVRIADVSVDVVGLGSASSTSSSNVTVAASDMVRLVGIHTLDSIAAHPEDITFVTQTRPHYDL